jgi:catalase (peroxidase I)
VCFLHSQKKVKISLFFKARQGLPLDHKKIPGASTEASGIFRQRDKTAGDMGTKLTLNPQNLWITNWISWR